MKYLTALILSLVSSVAFGAPLPWDSEFTHSVYEAHLGIPQDACVSANAVSLYVVKKLDTDLYETVSFVKGKTVARGALKLHGTEIKGTGFVDLHVRYKGSQVAPLDNGFTAKFGLWEECSVPKTTQCHMDADGNWECE